MELIWGCSRNPDVRDAIAKWASGHIWPGTDREFGPCTCVAAFAGGRIVGCVVFSNYDPEARVIEFSMAATSGRWLTMRLMEEMRSYCIDQLKCQMVMAKTKASNDHIRRMLKSYGFSEHIIPRLYGVREDGVIFTITAEQVAQSPIGRRSRDGST